MGTGLDGEERESEDGRALLGMATDAYMPRGRRKAAAEDPGRGFEQALCGPPFEAGSAHYQARAPAVASCARSCGQVGKYQAQCCVAGRRTEGAGDRGPCPAARRNSENV